MLVRMRLPAAACLCWLMAIVWAGALAQEKKAAEPADEKTAEADGVDPSEERAGKAADGPGTVPPAAGDAVPPAAGDAVPPAAGDAVPRCG